MLLQRLIVSSVVQLISKTLIATIVLVLLFIHMYNQYAHYLGYAYLPLSFGLVIGCCKMNSLDLTNLKLVFYNLLIALATFSLSAFIIYLVISLNLLGSSTSKEFIILIVKYLIAPLVVIFSYLKFYKITVSSTITVIVLSTVTALIITVQSIAQLNIDVKFWNMLNSYLIWQLLVFVGIQSSIIISKYNNVQRHLP